MPAPPMAPAATPPAPVAVAPNPAFLAPPAPPPAGPTYVMTAKAQGQTREAWNAAGWSDALLLQHGMMVAG